MSHGILKESSNESKKHHLYSFSLPAIVASYILGVVLKASWFKDVNAALVVTTLIIVISMVVAVAIKAFVVKVNPQMIIMYPLFCMAFFLLALTLTPSDVITRSQMRTKQKTTNENSNSAGSYNKEITKSASQDPTSSASWLDAFVMQARERIEISTGRFLPKAESGLMRGILLGDTEDIPADIKSSFKRTGLAHILAVSGMNVTMLVTILYFLSALLPIGRISQLVVMLLMIGFYTLLVGMEPSILRASAMGVVAISAVALARKPNLINALSVAGLATLIYDPGLLFSVSWQLSFVATLYIILLVPVFKDTFSFLPRLFSGILAVTIAAQLGVTPILIYYFGQVSLVSVIANFCVSTVVFLAMVVGMTMVVVDLISPFLTYIVSLPAHLILLYMIETAHFLSALPYAAVHFKSMSGLVMGIYYGLLLLLSLFFRRKKMSISLISLVIIVLLLFSFFAGCQIARQSPPHDLRVVFIDVGQGDASLIQAPDGSNILIDGGPFEDSVSTALEHYGVKDIDLVVLSHPHADHVSGLLQVVKNYQVDMVIDSGVSHDSYFYSEFRQTIEERNITYIDAESGESFKIGADLTVDIVWPEKDLASQSLTINDSSVVVRISYGKMRLLFTGDIEKEAQSLLTDAMHDKKDSIGLNAQVLKMPHHGSSDGCMEEFLEKVDPDVAIMFAGRDNSFGHPARSTIRSLKDLGAQVFRTDSDGNIILYSDGLTYEIETEK